jgi:hypothetical protein
MTCRSCASEHQTEVDAEINLHFPKPDQSGSADLLLFRRVLLCLHCGLAEFFISEHKLNPSVAANSSYD